MIDFLTSLFNTSIIQVKHWLLDHAATLLVFVVLVVASPKLVRTVHRRLQRLLYRTILANLSPEREKKLNTLQNLAVSAINTTLFVLYTMLFLKHIGVDIAPILAAAGVLGVAVGFGARRFVEDIITGLIILCSDQVRVGDIIEIANHTGTVEKVNLTMVVLRDIHGHVHFIRNGMIDAVTNMTKDFSYTVFDIGIAYKEDVERVKAVMIAVADALRQEDDFTTTILEPLEVLGLDRFDESSMALKARLKTTPGDQWRVGRTYHQRLKQAFDAAGIEIPFPQRVLTMVNPDR